MRFSLWIATFIVMSNPIIAGTEDDLFLLPPADDWDYLFPPEHYTPETLHEYINGAAELYRRYDLAKMETATYVNRNDSSLTFTVDLYKFNSPLCAFGVYSYYRQTDSRFAAIGGQAVVSSMNVRLWQAEYYINIVSGATDPRMEAKLLETAQTLSSRLPTGSVPDELSLLPPKHQVPNSQKYIHRNYLDIDGLNHVVEARYRTTSDEWTAFVEICETELEQTSAEEKLLGAQAILIRKRTLGHDIIGVREFTNPAAAKNFLRLL